MEARPLVKQKGESKMLQCEHSKSARHWLGREFGGKVRSWCTFNEPGVYTFSGYCMGGFPPAKAMHLRTAGRVLKHMLIAHTDAYRLIKGLPGARLSCM